MKNLILTLILISSVQASAFEMTSYDDGNSYVETMGSLPADMQSAIKASMKKDVVNGLTRHYGSISFKGKTIHFESYDAVNNSTDIYLSYNKFN